MSDMLPKEMLCCGLPRVSWEPRGLEVPSQYPVARPRNPHRGTDNELNGELSFLWSRWLRVSSPLAGRWFGKFVWTIAVVVWTECTVPSALRISGDIGRLQSFEEPLRYAIDSVGNVNLVDIANL